MLITFYKRQAMSFAPKIGSHRWKQINKQKTEIYYVFELEVSILLIYLFSLN